jgi:hypothetical protein
MESHVRRPGFDEVHAAFQRFPAPLALADAGLEVLQAKEAWSARFGSASLVAGSLEHFPPAGPGRGRAAHMLTLGRALFPLFAKRPP